MSRRTFRWLGAAAGMLLVTTVLGSVARADDSVPSPPGRIVLGDSQSDNGSLSPAGDFVVPDQPAELSDQAESAEEVEEAVEETYDPFWPAWALLGRRYVYGSAAGRTYFGPDPIGLDCSGFVAYVERLGFGRYVPASTGGAWGYSYPVASPIPGDLAFWGMGQYNPRLQHIALYIGEGQVIQSGGRFAYVNIDSAWAIGKPTFRRLA